ncbi:MAG: 3-deoxy-D-manno-octulosonic acid transferase [Eudoraea sp.]|nr:3-deoxy-D-manno-octulosonic acid transferase [Eudoraea sp.]NNJ40513.1 3-deoxy-D-manno-octulosonic acid transferase [Eudoraea sp.]
MYFLYNFFVYLAGFLIYLVSPFNKKIRLFRSGRRMVFSTLEEHLDAKDPVIWIHAASLGEYEQGLPLMEALKVAYPGHQILVTFFSPSGYEVKKNSAEADLVTYLPMDTRANCRRFLKLANPRIAIFIKYEIWPNYLRELQKNNIPVVLVSAIFSKNQPYFRFYGGFMRTALRKFDHLFLQDQKSTALLDSIGIKNHTLSGDTRFDRVMEILGQEKPLPLISRFIQDQPCLVAGSTWPEDEKLIVPYINNSDKQVKFILVPHDIKPAHIRNLTKSIKKTVALYSQLSETQDFDCSVLVVDSIGLLTSLYSFAQIAYVGGGFATGLHNTLEPAVYGIPVLIGPQFEGFREAEELVARKGILTVTDKQSFRETCDMLFEDQNLRKETGLINATYIRNNVGATPKIMGYLKELLDTSKP